MITLEMSEHQETLIKQASEKLGMTMVDFFLTAAHERATQIAKSEEKFLLTELLKDLPPAQFTEEGLGIQKQMRNEWESL